MRATLRRVLDPVFEPLIARLEQRITVESHLNLATDLFRRMSKYIELTTDSHNACYIQALAGVLHLSKVSRETNQQHKETIPVTLTIPFTWNANAVELDQHLSTLYLLSHIENPVALSEPQHAIEEYLSQLADSGTWKQNNHLAPLLSASILFGINSNQISPAKAITFLRTLSESLPARCWFARAGVHNGSALFLSALISLQAKGETSLTPYLEDVLERLMRHVEIKREDALQFHTDATHKSFLQERLWFVLCLLKASSLFQDLRLLNTALKMHDHYYRHIAQLKLTSGPDTPQRCNWSIAATYLLNICNQEIIFEAFFKEQIQ